ncbi:MAG: phosphoribosylformylglycinamidine synthase subunit PurL [Euryarchaeota archaeon]|nr:phosphoribosylformylglycinamidine synthase subunit PurL [Euryarchaeota archaeon]
MSARNLMIKKDVPFSLYEADLLDAAECDLKELSDDMGLNLSSDEMKAVREYFKSEGRNPTDIELQSLGQAWSEHCCYKSSKAILKEFVFGIDRDDVLSRGDAGVVEFDEDHGYALRVESHNHPSAIEPYGGAGTGVGGILRDVICMGAQPIALAAPFCFGPPDLGEELPKGVKHPRQLIAGAVAGARDYGNRCGVPVVSGGMFFDDRYTSNCLVNVGCFGIVRKENLTNNFVGGPGEVMILAGGRTGKDGIQGVNFASKDLSSADEDSVGKVQLGDPILKEALIHACLEVIDRKLVTGMKDLGGGGLSCVVGEMALDAGCGVDVDMETIPLKESGMAPWEIWISESQERMMCSCKSEDAEKVLEVFRMWDVEATPIGRTTDVPRSRLYWEGTKIFDMDLVFLTGGPVYNRPYVLPKVHSKAAEVFPVLPGHEEVILSMLSDYNVASKEWAIGQFDVGVRAATVVPPLVGRINEAGPGDAAVLMPVPDSWKGLAITTGCNPWFTAADPYNGGRSCIDETCRNLVAVGARPDAFSDCLNFGNPEKPERLGELREAVRGIGEIARDLNIPIPSGNVSLYNESSGGGCILPTPMIVGCGLMDDVRKAVTADLKREDSMLYLVGETKDEMGASLLFRMFGGREGQVPTVDADNLKRLTDGLLKAMDKKLVLSCHDCSDGGLAVAVAEMCISGGIGADLDLAELGAMDTAVKLYSESNTRWVVEVERKNASRFEKLFKGAAKRIGVTGGDHLAVNEAAVRIPVSELRISWHDPLGDAMEGVR